jgi:hypothetical protein
VKKCANGFGIYTNSVDIIPPKEWFSAKKWFSVDPCIAGEVVDLISRGVHTLASCCGHGKLSPTVYVDEKDIKTMQLLGYRQIKKAIDGFYLKTQCRRLHKEKQLTGLYLSI